MPPMDIMDNLFPGSINGLSHNTGITVVSTAYNKILEGAIQFPNSNK